MAHAPHVRRRQSRSWWFGTVIIAAPGAIILALSLAGPFVAPYDVGHSVGRPFHVPSPGLPFGTDHLGRDVLSRLLHGGANVVVLSVIATAVTSCIGISIGIAAAYRRGRFDNIVTKVADLGLALPSMLVLLVLLNGWGAGAPILVAAVVLHGAPFVVRVARAATLQVVKKGYVEQAVAIGEGTTSILVRELLPNVMGPLIADAGLRLVSSIYLIAAAGFLGFGPPPPASTWGGMISENLQGIGLNPWGAVLPALVIATLAISVNLLADRLATRLTR